MIAARIADRQRYNRKLRIIHANFDKRREIYTMGSGNLKMVETARSVGATAKFTGSGGAIVGTYEGEAMYQKLVDVLEPLGMAVFQPEIL